LALSSADALLALPLAAGLAKLFDELDTLSTVWPQQFRDLVAKHIDMKVACSLVLDLVFIS